MYITSQQKRKYRNISITLVLTGLVIYFLYHAVSGERGILAMFKFIQQHEKLKSELDQVRAERLHIEHRVNLMRSDSLDLDLLDEQVRKVLGYAKEDEVVYFLKQK